MEKRNYKIYAIDFDGTIVTNAWPNIGKPNMELIKFIKEIQAKGDKWILWTMRSGSQLVDAIQYCSAHDLVPDAVNDNLPELIRAYNNNPRKVYADYYIDDHNMYIPQLSTEYVELIKKASNIRHKISKLDQILKNCKKTCKLWESLQVCPQEKLRADNELINARKLREQLVIKHLLICKFLENKGINIKNIFMAQATKESLQYILSINLTYDQLMGGY